LTWNFSADGFCEEKVKKYGFFKGGAALPRKEENRRQAVFD
jgi:hypothetical protein